MNREYEKVLLPALLMLILAALLSVIIIIWHIPTKADMLVFFNVFFRIAYFDDVYQQLLNSSMI